MFKRLDFKKSASYIAIIVAGLMISLILILLSGKDIGSALTSFMRGILGSKYAVAEIIVKTVPLTLAALGIGVGFKTGFTNLGAEGQIYIGAMAGTIFALSLPSLPKLIMIPALVIVGFIAGGIWALIPGLLKVKFNISEIIVGIMLNYISIGIVGIALQTFLRDPNNAFPMSERLGENSVLSILLPSTRLHSGIIIALLFVVLIYLLIWRTSTGYQMRVCGESMRAGQVAGVSIYKNIILSALISGGLAGVAGIIEVAGVQGQLIEGLSPSYGYTAIMVALLGANHPLGIFTSAIGISALQVGSLSMQRSSDIPNSIATIILGIAILLVIARPSIDRIISLKRGTENECK
ncbi:ABC transporter permease [Gallicola sp. Sow4_E12]|uniref:ABC transporter permease n=1 Tax=Gallicola sp. Sow4_E12 TaxID=3438785 RepID=UPI003F8E5B23